MPTYSFQTRVMYDDVDQNLHLTLKGAMGMMQEAAAVHSAEVGYSMENVSKTRVIWMLSQWRIRLEQSAKWHECLTVETWPRTMERATSIRDFELRNQAGCPVAIGESGWALVNADTGRIMRVTPEIAAAYELTDRVVFDTPLEKIPSGEGVMTYAGQVQRRDIDTNHHVNNRVYLDYALEAMPRELDISRFREVIVKYHKQMLPGQHFSCWYRRENDSVIVDIKSQDGTICHGTVMYR